MKTNATLVAMLAYLASEDTEQVSRARRTVLPLGRNGQAGTWPECTPPMRTQPPVQ